MIYKVKKGESLYLPTQFKIYGKFNRFTWVTKPNADMAFDYLYDRDSETKLDGDWADWKKVGGISLVNWRNIGNIWDKNNDAIMLGWRYNVELETFEYGVYVNENRGMLVFDGENEMLQTNNLNRGVVFSIVRVSGRQYHVTLKFEDEGNFSAKLFTITSLQNFNWYSYINPWYGGANNSSGPWGGAAPQDQKIQIDFLKI